MADFPSGYCLASMKAPPIRKGNPLRLLSTGRLAWGLNESLYKNVGKTKSIKPIKVAAVMP